MTRVSTICMQVFGVVAILASLALHYTARYSLQVIADLAVFASLTIMLLSNALGRAQK